VERAAFLQRVRMGLERVPGASGGACPRFDPAPPPFAGSPEELARVFLERQAELGVAAQAVPTRAAAETAIARLIEDRDWTIVCAPDLSLPGLTAARVRLAAQADLGLCEAWYAVAETGSVAVRADGAQRRDTSLLPPAAGFIVARSRILARLGGLLRILSEDRRLVPACLTLITGGSASADIAGVRTMGVHGPGEVYVWLVEDE